MSPVCREYRLGLNLSCLLKNKIGTLFPKPQKPENFGHHQYPCFSPIERAKGTGSPSEACLSPFFPSPLAGEGQGEGAIVIASVAKQSSRLLSAVGAYRDTPFF